jgi:uncharacterized protein YoxC
MEIIGWISLAVVIGALVFLAISAFRTYKSMKPKIDQLQATSGRMQKQSEGIQVETEALKEHQQQIMSDIEGKKMAVMFTVEEAKQTPLAVKQLGNALNILDNDTKLKLPAPKRKKKERANAPL